ncbi:uncharacterized protein LOC122852961 isoform X2 [Aphidius gifuensis]|uniref:uncharacterized protein LOC122852961 isoform X2 n=1 Tax=Aphidius gifuensis TaxID=684658 RepID=UPI001CDBB164|nr:uncharacterized protein LOC122852961 isoform X2 [Aphidius gifuensis]
MIMANNNDKSNETVILILGCERVVAKRDKLSKYSLYFSSLFSENFSDHRQNEYQINYNISPITLKNFVNWTEQAETNENKKQGVYPVEPCLKKFMNINDENPLELLELSVVYMCEKLINDLTSIIILHWLYSDKIIDIWILAQELNLEKLKDISFAACLERFEELPFSSLAQLPLERLIELVDNVNGNCSKTWLRFIANEGIRNYTSTPDHDPSHHIYRRLFQIVNTLTTCPMEKKNNPKHISCIAAYKITDVGKKIPCVYMWNDGFKELIDLTDIVNLMDDGKDVVGRQIIGRGFSIYVVGGEQGFGSGRFVKTIWRYCLLSKTWFSVSELPRARRHMVVQFIKNKLYVIGGVGQHRVKLSTVDVLDIYTAAEIPEMFTDVPASCVAHGKIFYYKTNLYIYEPSKNCWNTLICNGVTLHSLLWQDDKSCSNNNFIHGVVIKDTRDLLISFPYKVDEENEFIFLYTPIVEKSRNLQLVSIQTIFNGTNLIEFSYDTIKKQVSIEIRSCDNSSDYPVTGYHKFTKNNLHEIGFQNRIGCFNIIDPTTLYKKSFFSDWERISV